MSTPPHAVVTHQHQHGRRERPLKLQCGFVLQLDQEISRLERLLEMPMEDYPKLTEELLFLLPESKVDGTPAFQRRRNKEFERYY